jgi:hypothetical protein
MRLGQTRESMMAATSRTAYVPLGSASEARGAYDEERWKNADR